MRGRLRIAVLSGPLVPTQLFAAGAAEKSSADRGKHLVEKGEFIPLVEIHEDSYISSVDMEYPQPLEDLGVTFVPGHRQIAAEGQEEIFLIGIQGRRLRYEDLPAVNQSLLIYKSGSMYQEDKMDWVKESVELLVDKIRDKDYVSLIAFAEEPQVVIPTRRLTGHTEREQLTNALRFIEPGGGTNIKDALALSLRKVRANLRDDFVNRILFFTDGAGHSEGVLEMVEEFHGQGIEVSAIGYGREFDSDCIRQLAIRGGGPSRFVASRESMKETLGTEFSRMVFPAAREVELESLINLDDIETWAYEYELLGKWHGCAKASWRTHEVEAPLPPPIDVAVSPRGDVYVLDGATSEIQISSASGAFHFVVGGAGRGRFTDPGAIAVDRDGNTYVADTGNDRGQKLDPAGAFVLQFGKKSLLKRSPAPPGELSAPAGVAVDALGNVFVADTNKHRIITISRSSTLSATSSPGGESKAAGRRAWTALWAWRWTGTATCTWPILVLVSTHRSAFRTGSGKTREALPQYIVRPPVSLQNLLVEQTGTDTVFYRAPYNGYSRTDTTVVPAIEFLAEVLQHLPDSRSRLLRT